MDKSKLDFLIWVVNNTYTTDNSNYIEIPPVLYAGDSFVITDNLGSFVNFANTSLQNYSKLLNIEKNGLHIICNENYKNILLILNVNIPIEYNNIDDNFYQFNDLTENYNEKQELDTHNKLFTCPKCGCKPLDVKYDYITCLKCYLRIFNNDED